MNEMNLDWDDLRLFLAVARYGGLSSAAESTGKSAPTLARRILALERTLGLSLFDRHPRGYVLTDEGRSLLRSVDSIAGEVYPLLNGANSQSIKRVKLSAGKWVSLLLSQLLPQRLLDTPTTLQFIAADHVLDINHREAIIGIRNHRPTQPTLTARRTTRVRFAIYAVDESVDTFALVISATPSSQWLNRYIGSNKRLEVTDPRNALDMANCGTAKVVLPCFIGDKQTNLVKVSDDITELEHEQWLVTHHDDRHLPEVRTVIDAVYDVLSNDVEQ